MVTSPGEARRHRGTATSLLLVGGSLVVLALPPAAVVDWLRPADGASVPGLRTGMVLLKVFVLLHFGAAALLSRALPRGDRHPGLPTWSWPVLGLLAAGLLLRLPGIAGGLWYDEIQTLVHYVRQPWGVLLTTFDSTNQHLLYSISARALMGLVGESATALRLPAVIFGVASLWAALAHGRRWLATREAWWVAGLLAVSYHHVWFSQNARGYTGLLLGTLLSTTIFLDLLRGAPATPRRVWGYAACAALSILTHVTALIMVAAHGLVWLWQARRLAPGTSRWGPLAALGLSTSLALTAYLPVLPQLLAAVAGSGTGPVATEWQNPLWFLSESLRGLMQGTPGGAVAVPVALLVTAGGVVVGWRRDAVAAALALLPLLLMAAALLATGHNFWPRFFFFGAAFLLQFAVLGGMALAERLHPVIGPRLAAVGLGAAVLGSLALLPRAWSPKQDFPAAVDWIDAHAERDDLVAVTELLDLPLNQWLGRDWPIVDHPAKLQALEATHGRSWVLYVFPIRLRALSPELWDYLGANYQVAHVSAGTLGGGDVVILARPPIPAAETSIRD